MLSAHKALWLALIAWGHWRWRAGLPVAAWGWGACWGLALITLLWPSGWILLLRPIALGGILTKWLRGWWRPCPI